MKFESMKEEKNAIVTGAYGVIGKAISLKLVELGYNLLLCGRREDKLLAMRNELQEIAGNKSVSYKIVDFSQKKSILLLSEFWNRPLDLLINSACTAPRKKELSPEGIEMQWATNVLGYYWMMDFMYPFMKNRADARIVNLVSYWAGGLDMKDPEFKNRAYNNDLAYRQSNQADRMLSTAFAKKLEGFGISVNSVHPGDANSKLSNSLGYGGHESPDQTATVPVWVATDPALKNVSGKYFENDEKATCYFSNDWGEVQKLMEICESY
jgi:retinol dehydrogenase 12